MKYCILIAALLAIGAPATSFALDTQKKPSNPLVIVDAAGRSVGRYGGYDGTNKIVYTVINGTLVSIKLANYYQPQINGNSSGFGFQRGVLYFAAPDCTGTPMIKTQDTGTVAAEVYSSTALDTRYLYIASGTAWWRTFNSVLLEGRCSPTIAATEFLFEGTQPPVNLSALFVEPFHVE
jgi:hypothetical protein